MVATDDSQPFAHQPVMVDEVVTLIAEVPAGEVLDATVGGGGHADAVLSSRPDLTVIGIDRDPIALAAAEQRLAPHGARVRLHRARFDRLGEVLDALGVADLSGFVFDLGVSSPQLDDPERGFSYRHDGPLDMRMDPDATTTAAEVVNAYDRDRLTALLRRNGDERFAPRIARAIVEARPIDGTVRLADIVVSAIPAGARRTGGHPAKRTFQAIRIEVNDELRVIEPALESALDALRVGGRGIVLTYHSGEDRIVKGVFRNRVRSPDPPGLPVAVATPSFANIRPLARRPTPAEAERNPRAASARLRSIERLAA
ncbi:MAG: 16S rRNA (cytosine(1402)-N(4))-methyltransferase RsmH [Acidimicrobiia bacterium]|nr:16S rRNA (cytosine(1402)-N(4))-methyltransferase RsmH [Acidimicrobiia bacterium]